jgi:hypothetical protein
MGRFWIVGEGPPRNTKWCEEQIDEAFVDLAENLSLCGWIGGNGSFVAYLSCGAHDFFAEELDARSIDVPLESILHDAAVSIKNGHGKITGDYVKRAEEALQRIEAAIAEVRGSFENG